MSDYVTIESLDGVSLNTKIDSRSVTVFSVYDEESDSYTTKKISINNLKSCMLANEVSSDLDLTQVAFTAEKVNSLISGVRSEMNEYINTINNNIKNITEQDSYNYTKLSNDIKSHVNNKSNPHSVTKAQVGLSDVLNYGMATSKEAIAGTLTTKYMNPKVTLDSIKDYSGKYVPQYIEDNSVVTDGDIILKVQSTQPAAVAGKTVIWIKA